MEPRRPPPPRLRVGRHTLFLLVVAAARAAALRRGGAPPRRTPAAALASLPPDAVVIVDTDNLRGKAAFAHSHEGLIARTAAWAAANRLEGRVAMAVDHGSRTDGVAMRRLGLGLAFAGAEQTADDLIVRWLEAYARRPPPLPPLAPLPPPSPLVLVTADAALAARCRRAAPHRLSVVAPRDFLAALGCAAETAGRPARAVSAAARRGAAAVRSTRAAELLALEAEMRCRAAEVRVARLLARPCGGRKRKEWARQLRERREEVEAAVARSRGVGAPLVEEVTGGGLGDEGEAILQALIERREGREHTWDRVLLAERLRRRLAARREGRGEGGGAGEGEGGGEGRRGARTPAEDFAAWACTCAARPARSSGGGGGSVGAEARPPPVDLVDLPAQAVADSTGGEGSGEAAGLEESAAPPPARAEVRGTAGDSAVECSEHHVRLRRAVRCPTTPHRLLHRLLLLRMHAAYHSLRSPLPTPLSARQSLRITCAGKGPAVIRHLSVGARLNAPFGVAATPAGRAASRRERRRRSHAAALAALGMPLPPSALPPGRLSPPAAAAVGGARSPAAAAVRRTGGVRLVVVSDTHGFEAQMGAAPLPHGDVLVHCGDWSSHGDAEQVAAAARRFDAWLAAQPHTTILVLRGNHDPPSAEFPLSGAVYATTPTRVEVGELDFDLVPYFHQGRLGRFVPTADVLVTHEPPHGILDRCIGGKRVGSPCLRRAVRQSRAPPRLWLFGHIHEAAGAEVARFGRDAQATACVNACNANPGLAKRLVVGPLVVDLQGQWR
ncbi:hypothetical protein AB1Y20_023575 [Prymnesium parvum]|uniref:Calcineurin-like phosphoesterase domain-containing protein n=1 Tax=Prymnesium parvum TaxID=97485 RepID=A0AB34JH51_PRYPA